MGFLFLHVVVLMYFGSAFPHVAGSMQSGNETDHLALLAFKFAITSDPFGALNSWNASNHFCQWVGVTCGRRHERVTVLNLNHRKLTGPISPHIGNLSFLRELWLRNNSLSHKIPPELGRLRGLQIMTMRNNSLTGEIPTNISACSELQRLDFFGNKLSGKFPANLGFLSKLRGLYFERNNLEGGIPSTFGNLSSLQEFLAHANNISGTIPDALGRLTKLDKISLGFNMLVGTIPSSILNLSSLTWLHLPENQIQGSLPSDLGFTLPNLQVLEVGGNFFTGSVPISVSNATKLNYLGFSYNELTGNVPNLGKLHDLLEFILENNRLGTGEVDDLSFLDSLTNATNLYKLYLGYNHFGGVLPQSISNFSANLFELSMDSNKIDGDIPTGIGNLISLQLLQLSNNHFTGNLPTDIGKLQKLQYLFLSGNKLYGDIPSSLGNLTLLSKLHLDDNSFDGSIPSSLGKCPLLVVLELGGNNLIGAIPPEVTSVSSLLNLNLSYNHLTGSLQAEIGNLINLERLDVSENILSGKIPSTIGRCVKLTLLHMAGNKFWGVIPSSLSNLRGMEDLDLSCNNFSGKIPEYFEGFVFVQKLNLSFNNFEGAVPERGKFRNATILFVKGNNKLCGGIPELQLHSCDSKGSRKKHLALILKIVIPASFGLLGLAVILSLLSNKWSRKTTKKTSLSFLGSSVTKISYQSLLKATEGFSPTNLIGEGSFGSVYKGILDQGGKVAVKVLKLQFHCASKSFIAECRALKSIRHRNLIKLITVCSSIDCQGNDFKALVYEFMVNGSLEEWLHPNENKDEPHEESRNLNLLMRLNIAIDVASALDYLHHHCLDTIIHCDLKPSNILLDGGMVAHVGDFGLSRFLVQATSNSSANQSSSIGIRGSVGYAAPEYGMGNEASTSGDVYSYGILLLEMFTGMRPTHRMFSDGHTLHNYAKLALPEQTVSIADPTLFQHKEEGETSSSIESTQNDSSSGGHKIQECLISVLKVGIACSEELPAHRPQSNDVVSQLHAIRKSLLESGVHGG